MSLLLIITMKYMMIFLHQSFFVDTIAVLQLGLDDFVLQHVCQNFAVMHDRDCIAIFDIVLLVIMFEPRLD